MKISRKAALSGLVCGLVVLALVGAGAYVSLKRRSPMHKSFEGREIRGALIMDKDFRNNARLTGGFCYELLEKFAKDNGCGIEILAETERTNYLDSLRMGVIQIAAFGLHDAPHDDSLVFSHHIDSIAILAVAPQESQEMSNINEWIRSYSGSERNKSMRERYMRVYNPQKKARQGGKVSEISPYDSLIRIHADSLGWDWRLLAAVMYNESRFSILARSGAGAYGLMQVMPRTAGLYGYTNLLDPDSNIGAGAQQLRALESRYRHPDISGKDRLRFTLAAYNAGSGRIRQGRELADSLGRNKYSWEEVRQYLPQESVGFVGGVMSTYNAFKEICPED